MEVSVSVLLCLLIANCWASATTTGCKEGATLEERLRRAEIAFHGVFIPNERKVKNCFLKSPHSYVSIRIPRKKTKYVLGANRSCLLSKLTRIRLQIWRKSNMIFRMIYVVKLNKKVRRWHFILKKIVSFIIRYFFKLCFNANILNFRWVFQQHHNNSFSVERCSQLRGERAFVLSGTRWKSSQT